MSRRLITIAIHQKAKATIAKALLEQQGIFVVLEEMYQEVPAQNLLLGYCVKVDEKDASRALVIIGTNRLFSNSDEDAVKIDDGRPRVLVAVDFSEYSMQACKAAFDIAKQINAKVKILNVFHNMRYPLHMPFGDALDGLADEGMLDKARRKMLNLCQEIEKNIEENEMASVNYSYSLREGIVEEEIQNFVEEYKPVLLVLGTKGMDNNTTDIVGNVTADIIEITNVPVLAVPLKNPVKRIAELEHIGFLTNVDRRDLDSFDTFVSFLRLYKDLKVTLIHVNYDSKGGRFSEEQLSEMQQYFAEHYPDLNVGYKVINTDNLVDAVNDFVVKEKIGMLSLNTRKRNILGRLFRPSMSRKLLNINISLLILRG